MDVLNYLRDEIKAYFPESSELQLSSAFANHRRFNFYFEIAPQQRFLLYLSWDGDYDRFTLKSLEFSSEEELERLAAAYPEKGSKAFNIGRPRATVSFESRGGNNLSALEFKGAVRLDTNVKELSGRELMQCVNPFEG
ncbi:hypothetical protein [Dyadobacter psychrophilus]|uniref:Uncharacterized protein n=1 Tax=Dyadobacter psychrophilus TaxID=651661 RepID=A0A1T5BVN4_9BACT|nr:hypothetical protein [Dyadobacter psychrophilus]SKB51256.1 hypothetical protein SAMN05660293_00648 [Dyadobacter psychrophilus]